jgi:hypothetical protein
VACFRGRVQEFGGASGTFAAAPSTGADWAGLTVCPSAWNHLETSAMSPPYRTAYMRAIELYKGSITLSLSYSKQGRLGRASQGGRNASDLEGTLRCGGLLGWSSGILRQVRLA